MIKLKSYIWLMIVKRRAKACSKVKATIQWTDVFTQTSSKNINQRI